MSGPLAPSTGKKKTIKLRTKTFNSPHNELCESTKKNTKIYNTQATGIKIPENSNFSYKI